jgi:deoxyribodipyrimidine photolyase-related protein
VNGYGVHKRRLAYLLSAMRHFAAELEQRGLSLVYHRIDDARALGPQARGESHAGPMADLRADLARIRPTQLRTVRPGDTNVDAAIAAACREHGVRYEVLEDTHFFTVPADFAEHMSGRSSPLLERFYRPLRSRLGILMTESGTPVGGSWNFDRENRRAFSKTGPEGVPSQPVFGHDGISREVQALVEERFRDHPGDDAAFDLPVTPQQAEEALADFAARRLPHFGDVQDAMWTGEPFLYHSRLSAPLNLKLISPQRVVAAAQTAYREGRAPINAVEGFVRQVLGWREYVRGVYFHYMPEYAGHNALGAREALPRFYWTGETEMRCLSEVMGEVRAHAYAHHIQRLMVAGLFALLYGVHPGEFNDWHVAMYADAFDWVSVPNVIGMSLHADGGIVGSKPYTASGKYIQRMSNYCRHCRFAPAESSGESACPFTSLYWSFLERHAERFRSNRRMAFQIKNLDRKSEAEREAIRAREADVRNRAAAGNL